MTNLEHNETQRIFRGSPYYYERVLGRRMGDNPLDFLSINLPPSCNYRCEFCLSGMNGIQLPRNALTSTEIHNIIDQAQPLGINYIEISGEGEPIIYRRLLEDIIPYASSRGIESLLFTNGSLLDRGFIEMLIQNNASLAISLEHMDRERYEHFTGRQGSYDTAIANINLAREMFRPYTIMRANHEGNYYVMRLAIHSIVTSENIDEIPQIRDFCDDDIFLSIAPIMNRGNATQNPELLDINRSVEDIVRIYSDNSIILADHTNVGHQVCGTFNNGLGIRYDGEVLFDAHAYDTAGMFGNVREQSLMRSINRIRDAQQIYYRHFDDGGFCPLRNREFGRFVECMRSGT